MDKKKGRTKRHDPQQDLFRNSTGNVDPLIGWHSLAKPARENRRQKRTWRRKSGGAILVDLAALLSVAVLAGSTILGAPS